MENRQGAGQNFPVCGETLPEDASVALSSVRRTDCDVETQAGGTQAKECETARRIPVALRDEVLARDGYCCTYVGSTGGSLFCFIELGD